MPAFRRGPWRRVGLGRAAGQPYTIVQGCRFNSGHTAALRTDPARGCSHATKSATHDRRERGPSPAGVEVASQGPSDGASSSRTPPRVKINRRSGVSVH
jgi:hypothetical protein